MTLTSTIFQHKTIHFNTSLTAFGNFYFSFNFTLVTCQQIHLQLFCLFFLLFVFLRSLVQRIAIIFFCRMLCLSAFYNSFSKISNFHICIFIFYVTPRISIVPTVSRSGYVSIQFRKLQLEISGQLTLHTSITTGTTSWMCQDLYVCGNSLLLIISTGCENTKRKNQWKVKH